MPLLLSAALVLIAQGLTMPALEIRAFIFWRDEFTILENIENLYRKDRLPAALILGAASVAYPAMKILAMFFLWLAPFPARWRSWFVHVPTSGQVWASGR